jgi:exopolysaccharide biosynthesis polyprenyl glycosylphosphotransferase
MTTPVIRADLVGTGGASAPLMPGAAAARSPRGGLLQQRARRVTPHTVLTLTDAVTVAVALLVVTAVVPSHSLGAADPHRVLAFTGTLWGATMLSFLVLRVHAGARQQVVPSAAHDLGKASLGVLAAALVLLGVVGIVGEAARSLLPPGEILVAVGVILLTLPGARALGLAVADRLGAPRPRVVIVGTGTIAADVASRLGRARTVEFLGYVDDDPTPDQRVLGTLGELHSVCRTLVADHVVVAFSRAHPESVATALRQLSDDVSVTVVPRYFDLTGWESRLGDLGGLPTVSLGSRPSTAARAVKRTVDVAGASLCLLVLLPLLVVVAGAVRLSSPGPVLFRQRRLGRDRRPFEILKFRTMREYPGAGAGRVGAVPTGPLVPSPASGSPTRSAAGSTFDDERRVTGVGRILRRTGIDELPQLVNIFRGDMSLVGPRPFVDEECQDLPPWADRRFDMRPGMTGLWQVCGQHQLRMDELYRLDTQYVRSWSLTYDVRILIRTPARLLQGGGDRAAFRRPA